MSWLRLAAPLLYTALLYTLSSTPDVQGWEGSMGRLFLGSPPTVQNLLHIPAYALLAALWIWALQPRFASKPLVVTLAFLLAVGYGAFDELHQVAVPGRYATVVDALLNVVGAVAAIVIYSFRGSRRPLC